MDDLLAGRGRTLPLGAVIYGVIDLQLRTLRLIDSTRARPRTSLDVATLFLDNDVMLTALPYSSMSIFTSLPAKRADQPDRDALAERFRLAG
jgi:hypothetical protein